jgi:hypothetical protein
MENALVCFVQELLAPLRPNQRRSAVTATKSTRNTVVERAWIEVNMRVSKPLKEILCRMITEGLIDSSNPMHQHAISTVCIMVATLRIKYMMESFNWRRVEGRRGCVPDSARRYSSSITPLSSGMVPQTADVVKLFCESGGSLTLEWEYGFDPLLNSNDKKTLRDIKFHETFSTEDVNRDINIGEGEQFVMAVLYYIWLTEQLMPADIQIVNLQDRMYQELVEELEIVGDIG